MSAAALTQRQADYIAKPVFETGLAEEGSDSEDFAEISKATLRGMLELAYRLGQEEGL